MARQTVSINSGNTNIINNRFRQKNENGGIIIPTLLALLFSLAGVLLGSFIYAAGFYSSIAGLVIAIAAKFGWELGKGKISGIKMAIIIVITLAMSVLTEFVGVYLYFLFNGNTLPLYRLFYLIFEIPANFTLFITDIIILGIFAIIGSIAVILQVNQELKLKKELTEKGLPLFEDAPKQSSAETPEVVVKKDNDDTGNPFGK